jgi:hypothetical protein
MLAMVCRWSMCIASSSLPSSPWAPRDRQVGSKNAPEFPRGKLRQLKHEPLPAANPKTTAGTETECTKRATMAFFSCPKPMFCSFIDGGLQNPRRSEPTTGPDAAVPETSRATRDRRRCPGGSWDTSVRMLQSHAASSAIVREPRESARRLHHSSSLRRTHDANRGAVV